MTKRDPNLVKSSLSRTVTRDGITVGVEIVRLEGETGWSLEVVNAANTSIVWDDLFSTEEDAYAEFERTVAARPALLIVRLRCAFQHLVGELGFPFIPDCEEPEHAPEEADPHLD